ncbi:MAG: hypothetical protein HYV09_18270 [Deltaproteobacteria bacterium]|nr:hypothetical protein [Deltaproteobacteria bacterium]
MAKRSIVAVLLAMACSPTAPPPASPSATARSPGTDAAPPKGAPVPCGGKACKPTEWCVTSVVIGGVASPPGTPPPTGTSSCAAEIPAGGPGHMCMPDPATRHVQCTGFAPSAPPPPSPPK